jgi:hypothetical protein
VTSSVPTSAFAPSNPDTAVNSGFSVPASALWTGDSAAQPDGSARFTAVWDGQTVTGTLASDATGDVQVALTSEDGQQFDGTITGAVSAYHIEGTLTAWGAAPAQAAGDQSL